MTSKNLKSETTIFPVFFDFKKFKVKNYYFPCFSWLQKIQSQKLLFSLTLKIVIQNYYNLLDFKNYYSPWLQRVKNYYFPWLNKPTSQGLSLSLTSKSQKLLFSLTPKSQGLPLSLTPKSQKLLLPCASKLKQCPPWP